MFDFFLCTLSSYSDPSPSLSLFPAMGNMQRKKALSQHYPEKHRGGRGTLVDIMPVAQQKPAERERESEQDKT